MTPPTASPAAATSLPIQVSNANFCFDFSAVDLRRVEDGGAGEGEAAQAGDVATLGIEAALGEVSDVGCKGFT